MKQIAHYVFLALVVYSGTAYWLLTTGDGLGRRQINHGYLDIPPPTGLIAILLHPFFSYFVLALVISLIVKEFFVSSLKKRFALNAAGLLAVYFFIGIFTYWF